jgi:hypothetical protein
MTKTEPKSVPTRAPKSWPLYATPPIGLLRLAGFTNIAAANRHHARDSNRPPNLLGIA